MKKRICDMTDKEVSEELEAFWSQAGTSAEEVIAEEGPVNDRTMLVLIRFAAVDPTPAVASEATVCLGSETR